MSKRYRIYTQDANYITPLGDASSLRAAREIQADKVALGYKAKIWDFTAMRQVADTPLIVAEIERRWRERTPAMRPDEVLPGSRVSKGELRLWCLQHEIDYNEFDPELSMLLDKMFRRLRKEFPEERWERRIPKWRRVMEVK